MILVLNATGRTKEDQISENGILEILQEHLGMR